MDSAGVSWFLAGVSAVLVGLSKTGMPGVSIPSVWLMAEAMRDAKQSVGAITPLLIMADVFAVAYYRRHARWDRLWRLFPYVIAGMVPAMLILGSTTGKQLQPVLGWLILAILCLEIARRWLDWQHVPQSWWFIAMMGFLAGFGTALGNAAGPVMTIYLIAVGLPKHEFMGTSAWFFFLVNVSKVIPYMAMGMIDSATLSFDLVLVPIVIISSLLGVVLMPLIPQRPFNWTALALAAVGAIRLIVHVQ